MKSAPKTYADVNGLITMLLVACEDPEINTTLERLLSHSDEQRKTFLRDLLVTLRDKNAPLELIEAMACLLDDRVAELAYQEIYRCARKLR